MCRQSSWPDVNAYDQSRYIPDAFQLEGGGALRTWGPRAGGLAGWLAVLDRGLALAPELPPLS